MAVEIRVPALGESVTEATVGSWFKSTGDTVKADEPLVELETDKVTIEVPAPQDGVLSDITVAAGETVEIGALLGALSEGGGAAKSTPSPAVQKSGDVSEPETAAPKSAPKSEQTDGDIRPPSPAARKAMEEAGLTADDIEGTGRHGQILKEDVARATEGGGNTSDQPTTANAAKPPPQATPNRDRQAKATGSEVLKPAANMRLPSTATEAAREERVKMSRLRQTIAHRLKDAQDTAAILTTFNDADMTAVMNLRKEYKELFERRHGIKLGFMGFFVKACIQALKEIPSINAEIEGNEIVYKNYYHVGVAVGTERGLVVPVLREAEHMTIAEIEARIADYGRKARDGKLSIDDMQGGTFTISNGGVYGSMLSTPILNAPQSGILGMHRIEQRAVVRDGEVVARPMMYLALSYDHRIVDGKEAVTFLVRVKECLEDPQRFMLEL